MLCKSRQLRYSDADLRERVTAVLFTDSVHNGATKWLGGVAKNYVTSDKVKNQV